MSKRVSISKSTLGLRSFFSAFLKSQSIGGFILLVCAFVALVIANTPSLSHLQSIWDAEAGFSIGKFELKMPLVHWVNDGLMAIFFLVVGLEIKREMLVGELSSIRQATLPIFAAVGGMVVPALIFSVFNYGTESAHGWGIPMATDIAFAIGVISLLGKRCPIGLKVFLTALAIVDDLGAIIVLAVFYPSHELNFVYLAIAFGIFILLLFFNRAKITHMAFYLIPGVFLWYFVYMSGIHATIAGVLLAITIPYKNSINELRFTVRAQYIIDEFKKAGKNQVEVLASPHQLDLLHKLDTEVNGMTPLMHKFEEALHPLSTFLIMPIFALVNAGVAFGGGDLVDGAVPPVALGIFFGLLLGKPIGIFIFSWISVKLKIAVLPKGTKWKQVFALGIVAGIGFTMSIFIDNLAFNNIELVNIGKAAILVTSFTAALVGTLALLFTTTAVKSERQRKQY